MVCFIKSEPGWGERGNKAYVYMSFFIRIYSMILEKTVSKAESYLFS